MSFLAPFFLLGGLAIALPVVFHLVRRTTREQTLFSSLIFLQPSPPRLTRKSRLEHLLLLLLRCLALALLAVGFARPFLKQSVPPDDDRGAARRIVVLVDTSASMRREGLWAAARGQAEAALRQAGPADQVELLAFDRGVTPLFSFDEWKATPVGDRVAQAVGRLAATSPGWSSTQLGHALVRAAEDLAGPDDAGQPGPREILLISDLQEGSRLEALQAYEWPKGIQLRVDPVKASKTSNAGLQLVTGSDDADRDASPVTRVRVVNAAGSKREQFQVGWARPDAPDLVGATVEVYVPPGQSRIVSVPAPTHAPGLSKILLRGDDDPFDDSVFVVPTEAARTSILYLGDDDATDTRQPLFFLRRALPATRRQAIQVTARRSSSTLPATDVDSADLFVITDPLTDAGAEAVRKRILAGKTALFAPKSSASATTLARLLGLPSLAMGETKPEKYAMLAEIDFRHPLFATFADPRFSDFTKIHFWRHRQLDAAAVPGARVLAKFDSGAPAVLEMPVGKGRVMMLTSGWQPEDSQLALSSKFVPLLYSLIELGGDGAAPATQATVGDRVPLAAMSGAPTLRMPDGTSVALPAGATDFATTAGPGIYSVASATGSVPRRFAVNLDPTETRTAPLSEDDLARLGVPVTHAAPPDAVQSSEKKLVLQSLEAESRQKIWRSLLIAALAVLAAESALAGWTARRTMPTEGTLA